MNRSNSIVPTAYLIVLPVLQEDRKTGDFLGSLHKKYVFLMDESVLIHTSQYSSVRTEHI